MADEMVIDLDEHRSVPGDDRLTWRGWAGAVVSVVLLALVLVLPGGADPAWPVFVAVAEVPTTDTGVSVLSSDRVFVADRTDGADDGLTSSGVVTAYGIPGGARRWRTRIPQAAQGLWFVPDAGVVVAVTYGGAGGAARTVVLEASTGHLLWSSASAVFTHAPAGSVNGLLFDQTAAGGVVRWVDLRTGRTVWSRAIRTGDTVNQLQGPRLSDPGWILILSPDDGTEELVAEQTSAVFSSDRFAGIRPPGEQSGNGGPGGVQAQRMPDQVNVVGGRALVVRTSDQRPATLTSFDLATSSLVWKQTGDFVAYPNGCGPMICLSSNGALTALDPATGAVAWRADGWQLGPMVDGDHLLVRADQGGGAMGLLDVRTGRVLMRMSGWSPVSDPAAGPTRLVVRPDARQESRVWFAILDSRYGAPSLLGDLPGLTSKKCQTTGTLLACVTVRRTMQIWRLHLIGNNSYSQVRR